MEITVTIKTGNAAFEELGEVEQVARIFEEIARKWRRDNEVHETTAQEANGNTVASVTVEGN